MKRGSMRRKLSECRHFNHNHPRKQEKERFDGFTFFIFFKKNQVTKLTGEKKLDI
jgi:hypothetical protein